MGSDESNLKRIKVFNFLKDVKTYYLATVDSDGCPRVRPFRTINLFENKLYFLTGRKKAVAQQIFKNSKIEIATTNEKGDWLRIQAEAFEDDRVEAKESMLVAYPHLRNIYDVNDENTLTFYLENVVATIESFSAEKDTIVF
jgi:uncharacterized pyridoxamine 5'-phosphate oxidase family protein